MNGGSELLVGVHLSCRDTTMTFAKVWDFITRSSLIEEPSHVFKLFVVMLSQSDQHGNLTCTPEALSRMAKLSKAETADALNRLTSPDPRSSTPDEEGRRVVRYPGNVWHIVNRSKYRDMKDPAEEREQTRLRVARHRAKKKGAGVTPVTLGNARKRQIEVEVETEVEVEVETKTEESPPKRGKRFKPPTLDEVKEQHRVKGYHFDPAHYFDKNAEQGWKVGKDQHPMKNWKGNMATWEANWKERHPGWERQARKNPGSRGAGDPDYSKGRVVIGPDEEEG